MGHDADSDNQSCGKQPSQAAKYAVKQACSTKRQAFKAARITCYASPVMRHLLTAITSLNTVATRQCMVDKS
jgi:hypothetical protein